MYGLHCSTTLLKLDDLGKLTGALNIISPIKGPESNDTVITVLARNTSNGRSQVEVGTWETEPALMLFS